MRIADAFSLDPAARTSGGFTSLEPELKDNSIKAVESNLPEEFSAFLEAVYAAYYSDEQVKQLIEQYSSENEEDSPPLQFDESVLERVRTLRPLWRAVE